MVVLASQKDKNEFAVEIDAKGKLESHFVTISIKLMIHSEKIESGITMNFNIGMRLRTATKSKVGIKMVAGVETKILAKIETREIFLKYNIVIGSVNNVALTVTDIIDENTNSILLI